MSVKEPNIDRAQRRKQQTRTRLLQATENLLNTNGYKGLSVMKITEEADLGYGTFYLHFNSLDDAVWTVAEQRVNGFTEQLIELLANEPPRRRIYLGWVYIFKDTQQNHKLFREMYGRDGSPYLKQARQDWLVRTFEAGMKAGHFQPHNTTIPILIQAQYLAGVMSQMLSWYVESDFQHTPEEMAATLYEMTYHEPPPLATSPTII